MPKRHARIQTIRPVMIVLFERFGRIALDSISYFEVLCILKLKDIRNNIDRKLGNKCVIIAGCSIIIAARKLYLMFQRTEFFLQLYEKLVGLEVWIVFCHCKDCGEGAA